MQTLVNLGSSDSYLHTQASVVERIACQQNKVYYPLSSDLFGGNKSYFLLSVVNPKSLWPVKNDLGNPANQ